MTTIKIDEETVEVDGVLYRREPEAKPEPKPKRRGPIRQMSYDGQTVALEGNGGASSAMECSPKYLHQGNEFYDQADAEHERDRRAAEHRVLCRLHELRGDWEPDWYAENQCKYTVNFDPFDADLFVQETLMQSRTNEWYAPSSVWGQVISQMPDDVKLALGVEE